MDPNELVAQLARLSALNLDASARARLASELPTILAYVARLSVVDTSQIAGEDLAVAPCRLREDVALPSLAREAFLPPPPRAQDGSFAVPAWRDLEAD